MNIRPRLEKVSLVREVYNLIHFRWRALVPLFFFNQHDVLSQVCHGDVVIGDWLVDIGGEGIESPVVYMPGTIKGELLRMQDTKSVVIEYVN